MRRQIRIKDHETFAGAWLDVLNDPEKAGERATASSEHMALYDCDTVVGQFLELMEKCIELQRAK